MKRLKIYMLGTLLLATFAFPCGALAATVNYTLRAAPSTVAMPDGAVVPVWGFALVSRDGVAGPDLVTVPGPVLEARAGDTLNVTVNVDPLLTAPVSLLIPGQRYTPAPAASGGRMSSFMAEATSAAPVTYSFAGLRVGSYLYESGSTPAVQIPMGLYGALVVRPADYDPAVPATWHAYTATTDNLYDTEATVVVSELDPALNAAVSAAPTTPYSTITSAPKYFLVNGRAYPQKLGTTTDITLYIGKNNLLRILNAGARSYTLSIPATPLNLMAADGSLLPYRKSATTVDLQAGRTYDAMVTPATISFSPVFERRLGLTNGQVMGGATPAAGGMLAFVGAYPDGQDCSPLKGDVTGDGKIDASDVLAVLRMYMGIATAYDGNKHLADVSPLSANGYPCGEYKVLTSTPAVPAAVDLTDVLLILRKAAGMNPY